MKGKILHPEVNTLNCFVHIAGSEVKLQFLTGLGSRLGQVEYPQRCIENKVKIASLRDLMATKLNTIQARAEIKDYIDIDAMLAAGISLMDGLACAQAVHGVQFDVATSLRALCSYRDGDLPRVPKAVQTRLIEAATTVDKIPPLNAISTCVG